MSVTATPGNFSGEEEVRIDGRFAGRIRRMSSGTYYATSDALVVYDGPDRSEAIQQVASEFRDSRAHEARQEQLDRAVERDREAYNHGSAEADKILDDYLDDLLGN